MNARPKQGRLVLALAASLAAVPGPAFAYIDPGTGGMLLQLLLGGVAGALVVIKLYWSRLKEAFSGANKKKEPQVERD
ncbi:MAG: hypothetical protein QNJ92_00600 [Alphaproteobacteria bacterium]|nr:hypothetical protein [Alphaproteobacteria bacterium]